MQSKSCVAIAGYGPDFGETLARTLVAAGYHVIGIGRSLDGLHHDDHTQTVQADLSQAADVAAAFEQVDALGLPLHAVIHNPAHLVIRPFLETTLDDFQNCWQAMVQSAVITAQQAIPRMLAQDGGSLIYSGATASLRGGGRFAAFASAKFALRGLAQSLAREFQPQGIHVAHVVLDGIIWSEKSRQRHRVEEANTLQPQDIAAAYLHLIRQPRSAWTQELDLRPASESF